MLENIKAEIIYYKIPKDFELEFNICGACSMRLLTSVENDEGKILSVLARAVSRNKIIIITGEIDDTLVENIAGAINFATETLDDLEIVCSKALFSKTIKGSVPLLTEDAVLGGCIVECGEQSLILLSSEKAVQREIMKNLIEPYLHALGEYDTDDDEGETEDIFKEQKQIDDIYVVKEETDVEDETEIPNTEMALPDSQEENGDFVFNLDPEEIVPEKRENKGLSITSLILLILLFIIVLSLVYLLIVSPILNDVSIIENLKNLIDKLL